MAGYKLQTIMVCALVCVLIAPPAPLSANENRIRYANSVDEAAVKSRSRPEYDPVGARVGSYFFYPVGSTGITYDDNVEATNTAQQEDLIWVSTAGLNILSGWGRHRLDFNFGVDNYTYFERTDENRTNYHGDVSGRLDISGDFSVDASFAAARLVELRGSSDAPSGADEPTPYTKLDGSVAVNKRLNRLNVMLGASILDLDYEDVSATGGGLIDQDIRDGQIYSAVAKSSYEFSPGYRFFGLVQGNWRDFGNSRGALNRDSEGVEARGGLEFEITRLMAGEISFGYLQQNYHSTAFSDANGLAAKANLLWNPTKLITIKLEAERVVSETTFEGASGRIDTVAVAEVDYEVLRNLIVSPLVKYTVEDYQGSSREDTTFGAGLTLQYLINRTFSATAYYTFTRRDSNVAEFDYDKNEVGGSLKVQF